MTCADARIRMMEGLKAGSPSPELEVHLATCAACRAEFDGMAPLWKGLGALPAAPAGPSLALEFQRRMAIQKARHTRRRLFLWGAAAGLLAACGFGLGFWSGARQPVAPTSPALALLHQPTAGGRLTGIALVAPGSDAALLPALLDLVDQDPSLQVRLSAVEALYLFGDEPALRGRLSAAVRAQKEPAVQMALIDLLVALRERKAAESLRRLLKDGQLSPAVQSRIRQRLSELNT